MEECRGGSFRLRKTKRQIRSWLTIAIVFMVLPVLATAQDKCRTVKECAQEMVELANELKTENMALTERINNLEKALSEKHFILAVATIKGVTVVQNRSTPGIQFDPSQGVITFPNPDNSEFVPIISDLDSMHYQTETNYIREILSSTQLKLWRTPMDTGARNGAPKNFTIILVKAVQ